MFVLRNRRAAKSRVVASRAVPQPIGCSSSCLAGRGAMRSTAQLAIPKVIKSNIENRPAGALRGVADHADDDQAGMGPKAGGGIRRCEAAS
jgi:hypothetical protein